MIDRRTFLLSPLPLAPFTLEAQQRRPNVVIILASGWRAQSMPWAGDPDLVLPNLEKLGKQSVIFPHAYSCSPSATPALAALRIGKFPHAITPGDPAMEDIFKSAGYRVMHQISELPVLLNPFLLNVFLDPPKAGKTYDPAALHPRLNVPSASEPEARKNMASRYGMYSALDESIGGILAELGRRDLGGETIVVFTADCGEQIGSQGLDGDNVAFEESVRIPLAIRFSEAITASSSDLLVSQADILPTLLGFCGIDAPDGVQGKNLSSLLSGQKGERPESVYAEGKLGQREEWRMLVLGSDKLVVNAQTEPTHLYNLADDPYENTNLVREPAQHLKRDQLLASLRASMRKLNDFKRRA